LKYILSTGKNTRHSTRCTDYQPLDQVIERLLETLAIKDFDELAKKVGEGSDGMKQLRKLFDLAEAYGFKDW